MAWKTEGTALYQKLPQQCIETLLACEPLIVKTPVHEAGAAIYKPFRETGKK